MYLTDTYYTLRIMGIPKLPDLYKMASLIEVLGPEMIGKDGIFNLTVETQEDREAIEILISQFASEMEELESDDPRVRTFRLLPTLEEQMEQLPEALLPSIYGYLEDEDPLHLIEPPKPSQLQMRKYVASQATSLETVVKDDPMYLEWLGFHVNLTHLHLVFKQSSDKTRLIGKLLPILALMPKLTSFKVENVDSNFDLFRSVIQRLGSLDVSGNDLRTLKKIGTPGGEKTELLASPNLSSLNLKKTSLKSSVIDDLFQHLSNLTSIEFSERSSTITSFTSLLGRCPNLKRLDFSFDIAKTSAPFDDFLRILPTLTQLTVLKLGGFKFDDRQSTRFADALAHLVNLEEFDFRDSQYEDYQHLGQILATLPQITRFGISFIPGFGENFSTMAPFFMSHPHLKSLSLIGITLRLKDLPSSLTDLEELELADYEFDENAEDEEITQICSLLFSSSSLKTLKFTSGENVFITEMTDILASCITRSSSHLEILDLGNTAVDSAAASKLITALAECLNLKSLTLFDISSLDDTTIDNLFKAIAKLTRLNFLFANLDIEDEDPDSLRYYRKFYIAAKNLRHLRYLLNEPKEPEEDEEENEDGEADEEAAIEKEAAIEAIRMYKKLKATLPDIL